MAVMLSNTHHAFSRPRPLMPNQINIGGAHLRSNPSSTLPADIVKFINGAKDGVVYMSLGAFVKSALMPRDKVAAILKAFGRLKQHVIWKWEDEKLQNLPANVMVRKWLPQADILANKNVKLFIAHGGIAGTYEGMYHAKPMLFIPFYGDQVNKNILRILSQHTKKKVFSASQLVKMRKSRLCTTHQIRRHHRGGALLKTDRNVGKWHLHDQSQPSIRNISR